MKLKQCLLGNLAENGRGNVAAINCPSTEIRGLGKGAKPMKDATYLELE